MARRTGAHAHLCATSPAEACETSSDIPIFTKIPSSSVLPTEGEAFRDIKPYETQKAGEGQEERGKHRASSFSLCPAQPAGRLVRRPKNSQLGAAARHPSSATQPTRSGVLGEASAGSPHTPAGRGAQGKAFPTGPRSLQQVEKGVVRQVGKYSDWWVSTTFIVQTTLSLHFIHFCHTYTLSGEVREGATAQKEVSMARGGWDP